MIIFNVTIKADLDIHNDFLDWVRDYSCREREGIRMPSRVFRLMGVDASDGITYCLQHYFTDIEALNNFRTGGELAFREELADRYSDKLVIFATVLSEV